MATPDASMDRLARPSTRATTSQGLAHYLPLALVLSAIGVLYSSQPVDNRTNPFAWDVSRLSGFATLIVGLLLAGKSKNRFERTMDRLARRGVLDRVDEVKKTMERRADRWKHSVAAVAALAEFALFVSIIVKDHTPTRIPLCLFYTAWAYIAGSYIGRMLAYACIGSQLKNDGAFLRVFPGHIDGAAGLRPIGDFCLRQALIVALPAAYLAVWSFLIPVWPDAHLKEKYLPFMHPYLGLLFIALVFEVIAFVFPMWWFHREMQRQKERLLEEADYLSERIGNIPKQLAKSSTSEERDALNEELTLKTKQFWDIERMPTWPVNTAMIQKFVLGNAPLAVPLVAELFGLHESWVKLLGHAVGSLG
jgi:hypothetical protein